MEILTADLRKLLLAMYEQYTDDVLRTIREKGWRETIATNDVQLVVGHCNLMEAFL